MPIAFGKSTGVNKKKRNSLLGSFSFKINILKMNYLLRYMLFLL